MILSISERTDIVAFYMPWFLNRLKEGYADVRNPFYPKQVSRILLDKDHIDAIIFCTKNPLPLLKNINSIPFPFIVQVTLTPYLKEIEPNVPPKKKVLDAIKEISKMIGKERVYVRYDPIFLSERYSISYHEKMFEKLCSELENDVSRVIISFLDMKRNVLKNRKVLNLFPFTRENIEEISEIIGRIAKMHHLEVSTCAEKMDLSSFGIHKKGCTTEEDIHKIVEKPISLKKNTTRENCGCVDTVDLGCYNTCSHFCKYCYANFDESQVVKNRKLHNPKSSLLIGELEEGDIIKVKGTK